MISYSGFRFLSFNPIHPFHDIMIHFATSFKRLWRWQKQQIVLMVNCLITNAL